MSTSIVHMTNAITKIRHNKRCFLNILRCATRPTKFTLKRVRSDVLIVIVYFAHDTNRFIARKRCVTNSYNEDFLKASVLLAGHRDSLQTCQVVPSVLVQLWSKEH